MTIPASNLPGHRSWARWLPLCLLLCFLLQILLLHGIGGRDDSYITYWAAHALSTYGEIVNYNGERIEQSSSLLLTLILAGLHGLTQWPIPELGIFCSILAGLATAWLAARLVQPLCPDAAPIVALLIALSPSFSYWSSSGMETSLVALLMVMLLHSLPRYLARTGTGSLSQLAPALIACLLFLLSRPEAYFVLLATLSGLWVCVLLWPALFQSTRKSLSLRILLLITSISLAFALLCYWRWAYFGQIFPQPVYAKMDPDNLLQRLPRGLQYLHLGSNFSMKVLFALMLGSSALMIYRKPHAWLPLVACALCLLLVDLAAIVSAGGDWMEAGRFLVPLIPLIVIPCAPLLAETNWRKILLATVLLLSLVDAWRLSRSESVGLSLAASRQVADEARQMPLAGEQLDHYGFSWSDYMNYSHLRDALTIPMLDQLVTQLKTQQAYPVTIASRQMGMIPYYLASKHYQQVVFLDLRGLSTRNLVECPIANENAPKSFSGILFSLKGYLEHHALWEQQCALPPAQVFYDMKFFGHSPQETRDQLAAWGFAGVYFQQQGDSNLFSQFIAVDNSLLPRLQAPFVP